MVYRRKRNYRKKPTFKRRRFNMTRKKAPRRAGYFKVIRWSSAVTQNGHVTMVGNDTVPSGTGTTQFALSNVNGFSELVSLFDNYRITRVLYRFVCLRDPALATTTTNRGIFPRLNWTHDFNDSAAISRDLIYQRANMKEFYFSESKMKTRWYSLRPAVLATMYETAALNAYSPKWGQWMDTADSSAVHYGIKYAYDTLYAGIDLRMEAKIFIECKGIS